MPRCLSNSSMTTSGKRFRLLLKKLQPSWPLLPLFPALRPPGNRIRGSDLSVAPVVNRPPMLTSFSQLEVYRFRGINDNMTKSLFASHVPYPRKSVFVDGNRRRSGISDSPLPLGHMYDLRLVANHVCMTRTCTEQNNICPVVHMYDLKLGANYMCMTRTCLG